MVRTSERACSHKRCILSQPSCYRVYLCCFECFVQCQRRKNCWEALGKHGRSGAARFDHYHVVSTGRSKLQRALNTCLRLYIAKVSIVIIEFGSEHFLCVNFHWING